MARQASSPDFLLVDEGHLSALRHLVLHLDKDVDKIVALTTVESNAHHLSVQILALVNLAVRGIHPTSLQGGGSKLLSGLAERFAYPQSNPDESLFCLHCCKIFDRLADLTDPQVNALIEAFANNLDRVAKKNSQTSAQMLDKIATGCLTVGWAHEYLTEAQTDGPLSKTQFFTPVWIADYLCEEALGAIDLSKPFRLIDPACGAGHLLVSAVNRLVKDTAPAQRQNRLEQLLGQSIYGMDLDARLVQLAAFSIYLTCRDFLGEGQVRLNGQPCTFTNLPTPNIRMMAAPLGSLTYIDSKDKFDAVIMNPPYLSTRTMDDTTAKFLRDRYLESKGDLYTAFIHLALNLLKDGGRLSTIVQQSFLSISRYRDFRLSLLQNNDLLSCIQLGTGAFPSRPGEKVNNAIITLEKRSQNTECKDSTSQPIKYLRLNGSDAHLQAMQIGLSNYSHSLINATEANELIQNISGQPFAFHCPPEVARIFKTSPALEELAEDFQLTNGLFTCNNKRFVKLTALLATSERADYAPYDKGGGQKWYHQTPYSVYWPDNGEAIRAYRAERGQSTTLPGETHYFKPGLTYSYIGTKGFKARLLSPDSIFDIASSAIFSSKCDLNYVLGFFNSALVAYLLSLLNPTVNFQIGDLRKIPFRMPDRSLEADMTRLAKEAIVIAQTLEESIPTTSEKKHLFARERIIQTTINDLIFDHYKVSNQARQVILDDSWVQHSQRFAK